MPHLRAKLHSTARAVACAVALAAVSLSAGAQAPRGNRNLLSINPLGIPFKFLSGEFERKASSIVTVGASLSVGEFDETNYFSTDARVRFYPNEEAFKGFAIGFSAGVTRVSEGYSDRDDNVEIAPTLGVLTDYNWILGKTRRVLVGVGLGAKRIFGNEDDFEDASFAYPTVRFQVGAIF